MMPFVQTVNQCRMFAGGTRLSGRGTD